MKKKNRSQFSVVNLGGVLYAPYLICANNLTLEASHYSDVIMNAMASQITSVSI